MATDTAATAARRLHYQQVTFIRTTLNWNDPGIATASTRLVGIMPAGALSIGTELFITTAFNAVTTNVLSIGSEATTNTNLVTTAQAVAGTLGHKQNLIATGVMLVPLTVDTPVYALYTQTGGAATAGVAVVILKYVLL